MESPLCRLKEEEEERLSTTGKTCKHTHTRSTKRFALQRVLVLFKRIRILFGVVGTCGKGKERSAEMARSFAARFGSKRIKFQSLKKS